MVEAARGPDWTAITGAVTGGLALALHAARFWTDRRRITIRSSTRSTADHLGILVEVSNKGRAIEIRRCDLVLRRDDGDEHLFAPMQGTGGTLQRDHEFNFLFDVETLREQLARFGVKKAILPRVSFAGGDTQDGEAVTLPTGGIPK